MFNKILIANRGEIAVRIIRTCRDMGIRTVALYEADDLGSLHVRLADEAVQLHTPRGYLDQDAVLAAALQTGAQAIHPGYGFLAERLDFIEACQQAGVVFIGPPLTVMQAQQDKLAVLNRARAAGFPTPEYSPQSFDLSDVEAVRAAADQLGYPVVIKSCLGGRGRGAYTARSTQQLDRALRRAQAEAQLVYGSSRFYVERVVSPAHLVGVQIIGDDHGGLIHLGEREGSLIRGNQKMLEEAPAPCLNAEQRLQIWQTALDLARLLQLRSAATIEFNVDPAGRYVFTEVKPRIQIEHPVTEMISAVDIVREQLRVAAGEPLSVSQAAVQLRGHAISCRITAEDPWHHYLPSPGTLRRVRLPSGPGLRIDTYAYSGCAVPAQYDPVVAKVIAWGNDRTEAVFRMRRALGEIELIGTATSLPIHQVIVQHPDFLAARYDTESLRRDLPDDQLPVDEARDLAVAAAIAYAWRNLAARPVLPDRLQSGWHRSSRRLTG